jgi:hypothetical protein
VLEVESGGALLARDATGRMSAARVPAPGEAEGREISGDGWKLALDEGWALVAGERPGDFTLARR